jgi:SAM-dependent methyltransferase
LHADASDWLLLENQTFDLVVCAFGLSDIDDLNAAAATVTRVLRPGGSFVWSILHPCFPGGEHVSASWPSGASYYDEGWWVADGEESTLRRQVGANHRMVSTYFNILSQAGLSLDTVCEPPPGPAWSRPDAAVYPLYLVARHRRPEP